MFLMIAYSARNTIAAKIANVRIEYFIVCVVKMRKLSPWIRRKLSLRHGPSLYEDLRHRLRFRIKFLPF